MSRIRSDLWCSAFVRRLNDRGAIAVLVRRGDPIAGQIWLEFDHLDGHATLLSPAPMLALDEDSNADIFFQTLHNRVDGAIVRERLSREAEYDPDFWHIAVEAREVDTELNVIKREI